MGIAEELELMMAEMRRRTGGPPGHIICDIETLHRLQEESNMVYASESDVENNTGYTARYMGIPITVSSEVDPGKLLLIPERNTDELLEIAADKYWGTFANAGWSASYADEIMRSVRDDSTWQVTNHLTEELMDDSEIEVDEDSFMSILNGGGTDAYADKAT